jgi:Zn-dependent peptidase ImmA (M78 family)
MAPSIRANVRGDILQWARTSAGLSIEEAARRIGGQAITPDRVVQWEASDLQPTVAQLRKMASVYRRPLAVFFLPERPRDFTAPRDFRRLPGDGLRTLSPELLLQLRRVQERREIATELYEELAETPASAPQLDITTRSDPEAIGSDIRRLLGVTMAEQMTWRDRQRRKPFNQWRRRLESLGVLVFQFTDVEPSEALGFSIADGDVPVVAVNRKLSLNGRIFCMMHELGHVLLRNGGLCDMEETFRRPPEEQSIEVFCNGVAASALVPARELLLKLQVPGYRRDNWQDAEIRELAEAFSVSREVIVRRLLTLGQTSARFYAEKRAQYAAEREAQRATTAEAEERTTGFESPAVRALSTQGTGYIRLVLESYHQGRITLSDVSSYLGVRTKHLPRIERALLAA